MSTPWATLTPFGGEDTEASTSKPKDILISKDEFAVGRAKACDHLLQGKKMVSGRHFVIRKAGESGGNSSSERVVLAELEDCSTNGTMLNSANLVKKTKVPLRDGDTINVVFGKAAQGRKNLGFVFRLCSLAAEEDADGEELEETQNLEDGSLSFIDDGNASSKEATTGGGFSLKRAREDDDRAGDGPNKKPHPAPPRPDDDMEENMVCCICQDILHDCVSVQPCMHCFCGGCYSGWITRSKECPQCRKNVQHVAKNHLVNNLVNAYLKIHPEKRRDASDLDALDGKNVFKEGLKNGGSKPFAQLASLGPLVRSDFANPPLDDSSDWDSDRGSDDSDDGTRDVEADGGSRLYSLRQAPPRVRCRQCVGNQPNAAIPTTDGPYPALPNAARRAVVVDNVAPTTLPSFFPPPPEFECEPHQLHVDCRCCEVHLPDRRFQPVSDAFPLIRRQICSLCSNIFCHAYFGCAGCDLGCLATLKETRFAPEAMRGLVLGNDYETRVLTDYMTTKGMTKEELFATCAENLDSGRYTVPEELLSPSWARGNDASGALFSSSSSVSSSASVTAATRQRQPMFPGHVTSGSELKGDTLVCRACALKIMKELAYQFREKDVDASDLPPAVVARQNCWWGRNCRTAATRSAHAAKLNHVCPQTRHS